jgi:hypothetical protein
MMRIGIHDRHKLFYCHHSIFGLDVFQFMLHQIVHLFMCHSDLLKPRTFLHNTNTTWPQVVMPIVRMRMMINLHKKIQKNCLVQRRRTVFFVDARGGFVRDRLVQVLAQRFSSVLRTMLQQIILRNHESNLVIVLQKALTKTSSIVSMTARRVHQVETEGGRK